MKFILPTPLTALPFESYEKRVGKPLCCERAPSPVSSSGGTVGGPHLSVCGGKVYWELRVVKVTGWAAYLAVGFAGTSFRCGRSAPIEALLGDDETSWAVSSNKRKFG